MNFIIHFINSEGNVKVNYKSKDYLFGILNLGHWDLFEIWFLVLGIFIIFIDWVTYVKSDKYLLK
jgi:hypothetical protein